MKKVTITKGFRRTLTDNNYGSYQCHTEIAMEFECGSNKELEKDADNLADQVLDMTQKDIVVYLELKKKKEVL